MRQALFFYPLSLSISVIYGHFVVNLDFQKNPRVRKIRVRNSGAGNGSPNFMDTWKNAFFLQENLCP